MQQHLKVETAQPCAVHFETFRTCATSISAVTDRVGPRDVGFGVRSKLICAHDIPVGRDAANLAKHPTGFDAGVWPRASPWDVIQQRVLATQASVATFEPP
jgi:hypothetical protein